MYYFVPETETTGTVHDDFGWEQERFKEKEIDRLAGWLICQGSKFVHLWDGFSYFQVLELHLSFSAINLTEKEMSVSNRVSILKGLFLPAVSAENRG